MDITCATPLLGGLSPQAFMRRHWQKKPLLVRQAVPGARPPLSRAGLFALAADDEVQSRLVRREGESWSLRHGPFSRRALPALSQPGWTLLVQAVDQHVDAAHELLARFRFVPDARLDDLMISYATDGGGVGPHFDSYDVFLLQVHGRRRWRIAHRTPKTLRAGLPLKILSQFVPEQEHVLEPGDMLYLPPGWAHDGVALGECMTCSIGFRAAGADELGRELLQRLLDVAQPPAHDRAYRDPGQAAVAHPGRVPEGLLEFGARALERQSTARSELACVLGEYLSEPRTGVRFEPGGALDRRSGLRLDRRTRMVYDARRVYINGEAFVASGADGRHLRELADARVLPARAVRAMSPAALGIVEEWVQAGWLHRLEGAVPGRP
jgi:50S ribosomal protein L16 3-hydroxylase